MPLVKIANIKFDPKFYPRANGKEDRLTSWRYSRMVKAGSECPPITIVATSKAKQYMLIDGKHRITSYAMCKREEIPAEIERLPQSKWLARSTELNIGGKRALDDGDLAWCAKRLEQDGMEVEEVAKLLLLPVGDLQKIVAERVVKLTAKAAKIIPSGRGNRQVNGNHYGFLKSPFLGFSGTGSAEDALMAQGPLASQDVVHILDEVIAVLSCGIDESDPEIESRMKRLRELIK